jgi:hypothetical protein
MHYTRWKRHGDPLMVKEAQPLIGADHPDWKGDKAGYTAVHDRLRRRMKLTVCAICGAEAKHHAYDHADPEEQYCWQGNCLVAYSTDLSHYFPSCVPCHKRFDLAVSSGAEA